MFYRDYQPFYQEIGYPDQWRNQEFQTGVGGVNPLGEDKNLLFGKIFDENCMKMNEIGAEIKP